MANPINIPEVRKDTKVKYRIEVGSLRTTKSPTNTATKLTPLDVTDHTLTRSERALGKNSNVTIRINAKM